jgi:hypothetical protein
MIRTSPPQLSFSSGEISPLLHRRADYQRFQTGLRTCNGFLPLRQGGVTRVPGTLYLGNTHENRPARLLPFQFSAEDTMVLELTDGVMRVWRDGELVLTGGGAPYQLPLPYDWPAIQRLQAVQSADVIYLADGEQPLHKLSRFALAEWTIEPFIPTTGPFANQNLDKDLRLSVSTVGSVFTFTLLTATSDLWTPEHVGALIRLEPEDWPDTPFWQSNTDMSEGDMVRNDGRTYRLTADVNTGPQPPIHSEGLAPVRVDDNNGAQWEYLDDAVGVVEVRSIQSPTVVSVFVHRRIPDPVRAHGTYRWSEGAWSDRKGYPAALEIHDQRLVAAATAADPRTVWFSSLGDFADFAPGVEADDPFTYAIAGDATQNRILWLKSGTRGLHIGALGEEYSGRSEVRGQAIGASVASFGLDGRVGSAPVVPISPEGHPIFISRDRQRVFESRYVFENDANRNVELSLPSEHLGRPGISEIVWQSAPQRLAWFLREDGDLLALLHDVQEDVLGWSRCSLAGGRARSLAVVASDAARADVLMMVVAREAPDGLVHTVELQAQASGCAAGAGDVYLFCAARFCPDDPVDFVEVPHLAGQDVLVSFAGWAEQVTVPESGRIDLPGPAQDIVVGRFDDTHEVETLDVQASAADGNTLGRQKRLHAKSGVAFHETAQALIAQCERQLGVPRAPLKFRPLIDLPVNSPLVTRYSGVQQIDLPSGHASEVSWVIRPVANAPCTITAITPRVQETG